TNVRNKRELALKFVDRYIDEMFKKNGEAIDAMRTPQAMAAAGAWDTVANVGNWYEVVAACYLQRHADAEILKSIGILERCTEFYTAMRNAKKDEGHGEVPAFTAE